MYIHVCLYIDIGAKLLWLITKFTDCFITVVKACTWSIEAERLDLLIGDSSERESERRMASESRLMASVSRGVAASVSRGVVASVSRGVVAVSKSFVKSRPKLQRHQTGFNIQHEETLLDVIEDKNKGVRRARHT